MFHSLPPLAGLERCLTPFAGLPVMSVNVHLFERRREMLHPCGELSLDDALADPLVQAIMSADAVHPAALRALMLETARKIELGFPVVTRPAPIATGADLAEFADADIDAEQEETLAATA